MHQYTYSINEITQADSAASDGCPQGSDQVLSIYKQLQAYHCLAELWGAAVCCIVANCYNGDQGPKMVSDLRGVTTAGYATVCS